VWVLIDNYDSFTHILHHYLLQAGADCLVVRNDALTLSGLIALQPARLILSPGPERPETAGITLAALAHFHDSIPVLGVCLGHQAIGQSFGGTVARARQLMHGKTSRVTHDGTGLFEGLPSPFTATRYHSLTVEEGDLPPSLIVNARSEDGTIMGFRHESLPIHGVQFHPESIATEHGHAMLANFMRLAGIAVTERETV
jgi:anthranilate synthase component II